ncbi:MAG: transcriptional repressor [Acidobacteriota bacterium]
MPKNGNTRETRQRRVVYEAVRQSKEHPTADMVFDQVRETLPTVSLGTVYRNLAVLKERGLLIELRGSDRKTHFEANLTPHAHFTCTRCGAISDLWDCPTPQWEKYTCLAGHTVEECSLEFRGTCPQCNA